MAMKRSLAARFPAVLAVLLLGAGVALGGWVWWVIIPLLALLGTPLFAMLALTALAAFHAEQISISAVTAEMTRLAGSPILISIPLFTLAGYIAAEAGTPRRLVRLTRAALGWFPGGLAVVAMIACAIFTAFTGASGITIIAMGGLLMPALLKEQYPERFTLGLLTTCGSLGILFPPSLALIIYSFVAGTSAGAGIVDPTQGPSVDRLFLAGILPGVLLVVLLSILAVWNNRGRPAGRPQFSARELVAAIKEAAWEIPLPFVLLGGIYGGKLTVTDAAAATALYVLVVEVFIYRDVPLRRLPAVAAEAMTLVGGILIILCSAMALTNYLIDAQAATVILGSIESLIHSRAGFLLALNCLLLIVGCLMDIFSALIVVVPLIIPVAMRYGVDLTHLGIIFLTNLEIGYSTPPVGMNLFIASFRFKQPIMRVVIASLPFLLMMLLALALVTYVPDISLLLVRLFG
jgi:C4-dicarboxylate transporter, DctM subunit